MGSNRKNVGKRSKPSGILGRGKGWRSMETCLWCHRSMIPDSGIDCLNVFMLTDLRCCWQYWALSISCTYNSEKDILKHGFQASNTNFFTSTFHSSLGSKKSKKYAVICFKKKKKHSKNGAFLILSCDKLWSHLQSNWLINQRSKGTVLSRSYIPKAW